MRTAAANRKHHNLAGVIREGGVVVLHSELEGPDVPFLFFFDWDFNVIDH
jgi:hypothetical protein